MVKIILTIVNINIMVINSKIIIIKAFKMVIEVVILMDKAFRWFIEFIAIIICGGIFIKVMNIFFGSYGGDYGEVLIDIEYIILYLAGVIWVSALRIVQAVKKKDLPK